MEPSESIAFLRRYNHWRRGYQGIEQPQPYKIGQALDTLCDHAERIGRELAALTEDVGRCHDIIGEDRASDTSELWKLFETHKQISHRLRCREEELAAERELADRLAGVLLSYHHDLLAGEDMQWLPEHDESLAVWKEARSGDV